MAQITYRANLAANSFPQLPSLFGRSVIIKGPDQNFNRQLVSKDDQDKDVGIPQAYYLQNILPTAQGFQTVGYTSRTSVIQGYEFVAVIPTTEAGGEVGLLGFSDLGLIFYYTAGYTDWAIVGNTSSNIGVAITSATVNGQTYIYRSGIGCYKYSAGTFSQVTLTGLSLADIEGITDSFGYMIAWSKYAIAWSSTLDPLDFIPSQTTGAGGGNVQGAADVIVSCVPHTLGFVVYTAANCVFSFYSGNRSYPFEFRPVTGSSGISNRKHVIVDPNSSNHYAYTAAGLEQITQLQTQGLFPDITDYLSGGIFPSFDPVTNSFVETYTSGVIDKALSVISDRYFVISYRSDNNAFPGVYQKALVFDTVLRRWGHINKAHRMCVNFSEFETNNEKPKKSFALIGFGGEIITVDFDLTQLYNNGLLLLGKYQYARSRMTQLESIEIENIETDASLSVYAYSPIGGKALTNPKLGTLLYSEDRARKYVFGSPVGMNHSILLKGSFNLVSLELTLNIHGKR